MHSSLHPSAACLAAACLAAMTLGAGCSDDEYGHQRLDGQSPQFVEVRALLDELRAAHDDGLDDMLTRQIAAGISDTQDKGLRYVLAQLARADDVTVQRVDRFGPDLYRSTLTFTSQGRPRTIALLLIPDDDDEKTLHWANTN